MRSEKGASFIDSRDHTSL